jgi:hypothetical protein
MTDKRNYRRINFCSEADIYINNHIHRCDLVDLALQGALFRTEQLLPLPLGHQARLSIYLPETAIRMDFVGELIHQQGPFYGFLFVSEDDESMGHLRRLLELNFGDSQQAEGEFNYWLRQGSGK